MTSIKLDTNTNQRELVLQVDSFVHYSNILNITEALHNPLISIQATI